MTSAKVFTFCFVRRKYCCRFLIFCTNFDFNSSLSSVVAVLRIFAGGGRFLGSKEGNGLLLE